MRLKPLILLLAIVVAIVLITACDEINPNTEDLAEYSCEGCHTNKPMLIRVIDALDLNEDDGGHTAPG